MHREVSRKKGKQLYLTDAEPVACANCHGVHGDGQGPIGKYLQPPPTNFTCAELMDALPNGQLFWVIKSGSGLVLVDALCLSTLLGGCSHVVLVSVRSLVLGYHTPDFPHAQGDQ
ncbi:c-type cytochrome [Nitrosococcus wardiae]